MLSDINDFNVKLINSTLIGRPYLRLKGITCGNIVCGKVDKFKKYKDNIYSCQCGYLIEGEFETEISIKPKLYCSATKCYLDKKKMDISCVRCEFIRERI